MLPARRLSRLQAALPERPGTALRTRTTKDPAKLHSGAGLRPVPSRAAASSPFSPSSSNGPRSGGEEPAQCVLLSRQEGDLAWRKRAVTGSQLALLAARLESLRSSTGLDINQKLCIHVTPTPSPPPFAKSQEKGKETTSGKIACQQLPVSHTSCELQFEANWRSPTTEHKNYKNVPASWLARESAVVFVLV